MSEKKLFAQFSCFFRQWWVLSLLMLMVAMPLQAETVNINKADAATLQYYLTGVGAVKAKAIVVYRNKHGRFRSVDDLQNVKGIGKATIEKNRKSLSISKGVSRLSRKDSKVRKLKTGSKSATRGSSKG